MGMEHLSKLSDQLPFLKTLEYQTNKKVKAEHFLIALIILCITLLLTPFAPIIVNITGIVIPLQQSINVVRYNLYNNNEKIAYLLTFWMIYSVLGLLDSLPINRVVPLYYPIKLVILIYSGTQQFNFYKFVKEHLQKNKNIKEAVKNIAERMRSQLDEKNK